MAFRDDLQRFVRHYAFLAQVVPYIAPDDETLSLFSRILLARLLASEPGGTSLSLSGMLELTHSAADARGAVPSHSVSATANS